MKNSAITFGQWILVALALILGFMAGKIFTVPGVSVSKELNPLHAMSIICSVFIAIYISIIFAKYKENQKIQKNLLFKRLDCLLEHVNFIDTNLSKGLDCSKVNFMLKKIKMSSMQICDFLDLMRIGKKEFHEAVVDAHRELRVLMTQTPVNLDGNENQHVKCKEGVYKYSNEQRAKIEVEISNIENITYRLQLCISQK